MPPQIEYPVGAIVGRPGKVWTNTTRRVLYQLKVSFANSCARCIQYANAVGPWWPVPFHPGCNCRNVPVPPGTEAEPFLDFQREMAMLPPSQQAIAMGRNNWRLIESGKVAWSDVVTRSRIRPLHEVIQRSKLTDKQLRNAGVPQGIINRSRRLVSTPVQNAQRQASNAALTRLRELGVTNVELRAALVERLQGRVAMTGKPTPVGPVVMDRAAALKAAATRRARLAAKMGGNTGQGPASPPAAPPAAPPPTLPMQPPPGLSPRQVAAWKAVQTRRARLAQGAATPPVLPFTPPPAPGPAPPAQPVPLTAGQKAAATRRARMMAQLQGTAPPSPATQPKAAPQPEGPPFRKRPEAVAYLRAKHPNVKWNGIEAIRLDRLNQIAGAFDRLTNEFPEIMQGDSNGFVQLRTFSRDKTRRGAYMWAGPWGEMGYVRSVCEDEKFAENRAYTALTGFKPKGCENGGVYPIVCHEFGHHIDFVLRKRIPDYDRRWEAFRQKLIDRGENPYTCDYAKKDRYEYFANTFEVFHYTDKDGKPLSEPPPTAPKWLPEWWSEMRSMYREAFPDQQLKAAADYLAANLTKEGEP
jgi:hypothetical protein